MGITVFYDLGDYVVIVEDVTENPFLDIRLSPVFVHVIVSAPSTKRNRSRNEKKWWVEYPEFLEIKISGSSYIKGKIFKIPDPWRKIQSKFISNHYWKKSI